MEWYYWVIIVLVLLIVALFWFIKSVMKSVEEAATKHIFFPWIKANFGRRKS